ncbi:hypothetical protein [Acidithiobacillus thiooxidans]|uniref:hypothetical protein n=1 Tax=Acidithiobacillus thiooxidans TaxID=930 RepID=UPI001A7E186D|nr:hypothetical protein [Acidithiobacillus thiooxidans]
MRCFLSPSEAVRRFLGVASAADNSPCPADGDPVGDRPADSPSGGKAAATGSTGSGAAAVTVTVSAGIPPNNSPCPDTTGIGASASIATRRFRPVFPSAIAQNLHRDRNVSS